MAPTENASVSPRTPKAPFVAASALFCVVAVLIGSFAIKPLGAAELLGLLACVASASISTTIPFALDFARRADATRGFASGARPAAQPAPTLDTSALSAEVAAAVEARLSAALPELAAQITASLAAAEEKRRAEFQAALAAATPPRPFEAEAITAPPGAKPRLGRGLAGLMHHPSALAKPPAPENREAA